MFLLLAFVGALAGFIDSIAGGGGLITVPVLSILLGPGAEAIGTNKIAASVGTLIAMLVYMRMGHVRIRGHLWFFAVVALSSGLGAWTSAWVPPVVYKWFIVAIVPLLLFVVMKKDLWIKRAASEDHSHVNKQALWMAGFACGFYDGIAGPGGGTLMFLSLFILARFPLIEAMATAKVANLASASFSLVTYAAAGHVLWDKGLSMAIGMAFGAFAGASLATKNAAAWARVALAVVSSLLVLRFIFI
jgi:uncharacterized protein